MAALALTIALGAHGGLFGLRRRRRSTASWARCATSRVALVALWIFAHIHPQLLMRLALPVYVVGLALLIGVALFGDVRNGARRWLNLGVTTHPALGDHEDRRAAGARVVLPPPRGGAAAARLRDRRDACW